MCLEALCRNVDQRVCWHLSWSDLQSRASSSSVDVLTASVLTCTQFNYKSSVVSRFHHFCRFKQTQRNRTDSSVISAPENFELHLLIFSFLSVAGSWNVWQTLFTIDSHILGSLWEKRDVQNLIVGWYFLWLCNLKVVESRIVPFGPAVSCIQTFPTMKQNNSSTSSGFLGQLGDDANPHLHIHTDGSLHVHGSGAGTVWCGWWGVSLGRSAPSEVRYYTTESDITWGWASWEKKERTELVIFLTCLIVCFSQREQTINSDLKNILCVLKSVGLLPFSIVQ